MLKRRLKKKERKKRNDVGASAARCVVPYLSSAVSAYVQSNCQASLFRTHHVVVSNLDFFFLGHERTSIDYVLMILFRILWSGSRCYRAGCVCMYVLCMCEHYTSRYVLCVRMCVWWMCEYFLNPFWPLSVSYIFLAKNNLDKSVATLLPSDNMKYGIQTTAA